jgi:selenocysteine lyase/cysteine desulfurase
MNVGFVQLLRFRGELRRQLDLDTLVFQAGKALAGNGGVGVLMRRNDALDSGR